MCRIETTDDGRWRNTKATVVCHTDRIGFAREANSERSEVFVLSRGSADKTQSLRRSNLALL